MTSAMDRMVVNAAIEKLITQTDDDGEGAKAVIAYGSRLKEQARVSFEYSSHTTTNGEEITGHSPDHSNLTIQDKEREKHIERTFGFTKERIGYFRLWKAHEGVLCFHHFWKSSFSTQPDQTGRPDEYILGYSEKSLTLQYLGIKRQKITFSFGFWITIQFFQNYLEPVYGTMPKANGRGFKIIIGR